MRRPLLLALSLLTPSVCAAQEAPPQPPRFEVGAQFAGLAAISSEGVYPLFAAGPRLSVGLTDRLAVELLVESMQSPESDNFGGLYQIQIRHVVRPGRGDRSSIFLTAGTIGVFQDWDVPEYRYSLPDGTIVVYPGRDEIEVERPIGIVGGIGMQKPFARYVAFRADAQALVSFHGGWVVRGSLGFSIPIGRYTLP